MIHLIGPQFSSLDYRSALLLRSEMGTAGDFATAVSGTAAAISFAPAGLTVSGRTGIASFDTGTTTTGRAAINTQTADQIVLGSGIARFTAMIKTPSSLSDATNRYNLIAGFSNSLTTGSPSQACMFRYRDNLNSGKWQAYILDSSGVSETIDLGITVAASTWYKLEVIVSASAGSAQFFINGALCGTSGSATPSGTSETLGALFLILKGLGTASRIAYLDFIEVEMETAR